MPVAIQATEKEDAMEMMRMMLMTVRLRLTSVQLSAQRLSLLAERLDRMRKTLLVLHEAIDWEIDPPWER